MIRNFGGVAGLTNQPQGLDIGLGGGSNIKSVQRTEVTFTEAAATKDITISAVDPSKSVVILNYYPDGENANVARIAVQLINATTVRLLRSAATGATADTKIDIIVLEYVNVKSKQTGSIVLSDYPAITNVTISPVDRNKSIEVISSISSGVTNNNAYFLNAAQLTSNTNLKLLGVASNTVYWQVIEFY